MQQVCMNHCYLKNNLLVAGHHLMKSLSWHIYLYIYTEIPVLMGALKAGSISSVLTGTMGYISVQFKLVSKSLEELVIWKFLTVRQHKTHSLL